MKNLIKSIINRIRRKPLLVKPVVSVSVVDIDKGKCTTCRFGKDEKYGLCWVGTYYAEQGKSRFCIEGELWETTER